MRFRGSLTRQEAVNLTNKKEESTPQDIEYWAQDILRKIYKSIKTKAKQGHNSLDINFFFVSRRFLLYEHYLFKDSELALLNVTIDSRRISDEVVKPILQDLRAKGYTIKNYTTPSNSSAIAIYVGWGGDN